MAKDNRSYNVFFNVHTVSGIVISIGLFVIFLAGAFALFRTEIDNWQYNEPDHTYRTIIDYDRILELVGQQGYETKGRFFAIRYLKKGNYIDVFSSGPTDKSDSTVTADKNDSTVTADNTTGTGNKGRLSMRLDPENYTQLEEPPAGERFLGTYIYDLHYFRQLPVLGRELSGFVALFFGLAVISGIIVHWKKVIPNFFTFRIKGSIKNLWTDAHVALGVLGLPFQFMYAITGVYLGIGGILLLPILFIQYGGNIQKLQDTVYPRIAMEDFTGPTQPLDSISINGLVHPDLELLDPDQISSVEVDIHDYRKKQGRLTLDISYPGKDQFMTRESKGIRLADGHVYYDKTLDDYDYGGATRVALVKLHYATFGGFFMKITYFILAIITCYVILSGVMIWLVARDKKAYAHKAKFNRNVGAIFIGACMGLFPAIALFFCLVKLFPGSFGMMSNIFLLFWLAYTIYSYFIKSPFKINKHALLLAGVLGLIIPILNGIQSGLWFWKSLGMNYPDSFLVDVSWIIMSVISLWAAFIAKPVENRGKAKKEGSIVKTKGLSGSAKENITKPILKVKPSRS